MNKKTLVSPFRSIGILGLGLIGGSLAKAIKAKDSSIRLFSLKRESPDDEIALASGIIDQQAKSLIELLQQVELLVIATPLSSILPLADEIALYSSQLSRYVLVIDVGSVKQPIQEHFEKITSEMIEFLPTHPMAGTEKSGFTHSEEHLFDNANWALTPHKKNSEKNTSLLLKWIEFLEARPILLEAKYHDEQVAFVSHLPFIIAKDFYDFVLEKHPQSLNLAGPGFHSFTRIAHDNLTLRKEIFQMNNSQIEKFLHEWLKQFLNKWTT
jgi:prephenate dehydrogenase